MNQNDLARCTCCLDMFTENTVFSLFKSKCSVKLCSHCYINFMDETSSEIDLENR